MRRKRLIIAIVVVFVLLVVAELALSTVAVWDGRFQLTVELHSRSGGIPTAVSYGLYNRDVANYVVQNIDQHATELQAAENVKDGRFIVSVPCSGREWLGVSYGYVEPYRFIVLRLKQKNGKSFCTVAEIPEGRGPRSLRVEIP